MKQVSVELTKVELSTSNEIAVIETKRNFDSEDKNLIKAFLDEKLIVGNQITFDNQSKIISILSILHVSKSMSKPEGYIVDYNLLKSEIETNFPNLTLTELEKALNLGVRGEYGDYFGLNVVTYHKWIKSYLSEEKRIKAINNYLAEKEKLKIREMTNDEIEEQMDYSIKLDLQNFKDNKKIEDLKAGHVKYNFLEKRNMIVFTIDEKREIKEKLIKILTENSNKHCLTDTDQWLKNYYKSILEDEKLLKNECKSEAYKIWIEKTSKEL